MTSMAIAAVSAACLFGGALCGLCLQRLLPVHHLSKESQDVVKLAAGVIGTVTALVLGLLISSAKGTFDDMSSRLIQVSAKVVALDDLLARYGPEARASREQLRRSVEAILRRMWPSERATASGMAVLEQGNELPRIRDALAALTPSSDGQRQLLAQAQQILDDVTQSRWVVIEEAQVGLPPALLVILVFWMAVLFCSFGLFAPRNATTCLSLLVCSIAMAGAIFLMLEMNQPLDGFIKVSSAPLRKAVELMGR